MILFSNLIINVSICVTGLRYFLLIALVIRMSRYIFLIFYFVIYYMFDVFLLYHCCFFLVFIVNQSIVIFALT